MKQIDALIVKIQFRDEQHNIFTEHVGIGSQFEIQVEDNETEEKDQGQVDNLEHDVSLQFTFRQQICSSFWIIYRTAIWDYHLSILCTVCFLTAMFRSSLLFNRDKIRMNPLLGTSK